MLKKRLLSTFLSLMLVTASIIIPQQRTGASEKTKEATAVTTADNRTITRYFGADRYETAVEIAKNGWITSNAAIIATGEDFPDALCAAPLAQKLNAPILLTAKNSLDSKVINELTELKVTKAYIVGGTGVVSSTVDTQLKQMNITVQRLAGINRFETAGLIADQLGDFSEVAVVNGYGFADALSMAPVAAKKGMPILLTDVNNLPGETFSRIAGKNINNTYIVGGSGVINNSVANSLPNSRRIWGIDRYNTNLQVLNNFSDVIDFSTLLVATGENFPDALAGSALAPKTSSGILLTSRSISEDQKNFLTGKMPSIRNIIALGGTAVVPDDILNAIKNGFAIGSGQLNDSVTLLDDKATEGFMNSIITSSANADGSSTIVLSNNSANLQTGDLFYVKPTFDNPTGLMAKVSTLTTDGSGNSVVTLVQPALEEIFNTLDFDSSQKINLSNIIDTNLPAGAQLTANRTPNEAEEEDKNPFKFYSQVTPSSNSNGWDYDELTVGFKDSVLYDQDDDYKTTNDQIRLSGRFSLKDALISTKCKIGLAKIEELSADLKATQEEEVKLYADLNAISFGSKDINEFLGQGKNERKIGALTLSGIDMSDQLVIGSITVGLGPVVAEPRVGQSAPPEIFVGATVMLTMNFNNTISAHVEYSLLNKNSIDAGFNYDGNIATPHCYFGAVKGYPQLGVSVKGEATQTVGIGIAIGVTVAGIIPAEVKGEVTYKQLISGELTFNTDSGAEAKCSGFSDLSFSCKLIVGAGIKIGKFIEGRIDYTYVPVDISLWHDEFGSPGNSNSNVQNNGFTQASGDYVYFINYNDSGKLYKTNTITNITTKLMDDTNLCGINVIGNYIYYTRWESGSEGIYRVALDGSAKSLILNKIARGLIYKDGYLFFIDENNGGKLCKVNVDGTGYKVLYDYLIYTFWINEDSIFASDGGSIYKMDINGYTVNKLSNIQAFLFCSDGKYLYYGDNSYFGGFMRANLDGTGITTMSSAKPATMNYDDGIIYFCNTSDGGKLYKVKTDGTGLTKLCDDSLLMSGGGYYYINVAGDWIYYFSSDIMYKIKKDGSERQAVTTMSGIIEKSVKQPGMDGTGARYIK